MLRYSQALDIYNDYSTLTKRTPLQGTCPLNAPVTWHLMHHQSKLNRYRVGMCYYFLTYFKHYLLWGRQHMDKPVDERCPIINIWTLKVKIGGKPVPNCFDAVFKLSSTSSHLAYAKLMKNTCIGSYMVVSLFESAVF